MRRSSGGWLLLLPVFLLAACGPSNTSNSTGSAPALVRIRNAVQRTEAAGTAHLVTDSTTGSTAGPDAQSVVIGDIRFAGPDLALTTTVQSPNTSSSQPLKAIYVGTDVYFDVSSTADSWVRGIYRHPYAYLGAVQPKALTAAAGPVTVVGVQEVNGEAATEYLVPIPGSVETVSATNSQNQPLSARVSIAPFELSVWLDGAGRIVRTQASLTVTSSQQPGPKIQRTTTTLSDFGEVVHIVAPATSVK